MNHFTPAQAAEISLEAESILVDRIRAGDQHACTRMVTLFGPQMMTVARRYMRCDDDCNDAVQDAFISAFNAIDRFEGDARLFTWLHRITVNSCLMKLRTASSSRETSIEELLPTLIGSAYQARWPVAMNDPSTEIEIDETRRMIRQAIDKLPQADRAVLMLRDIEEMDTAATAARLDMSECNVKRRLRRARQSLCSRLEPMMANEGSFSFVM
jgi:RNA polymerase sigma-70 factor (ECF subfamily)